MSFIESLLGCVGDLPWVCMVTLFIASVVTLLVYFVQYFTHRPRVEDPTRVSGVSEEADALLCWALSLQSWRSRWRSELFRALNETSKLPEGQIKLTFEEDGVQSSELTVGHISSFKKSPHQKNVQCLVVGDELRFSLSATPSSTSPETSLRYSVKISPLHLQLALQMRELAGEVQVTWGLEHLDSSVLTLTPSSAQTAGLDVCAVRGRLRQVLCDVRPTVALSGRPAQPAHLKEVRNKTPSLTSPPKPPRAHHWKLLVKNIQVMREQDNSSPGSVNLQCALRLDDPSQRLLSTVLAVSRGAFWEQPFVFELSGRSKELNLQLLDDGRPQESSLLGQVCVPIDLVKKHPRGQQTFDLTSADRVTGSLTAEFTYLEPSEVRTWHPPTPAPAKRVEMDRTVMPCGTVVTTVTAVKSRPGRALPPETMHTPSKSKLSERRVSEQPAGLGARVSKALSSSDTELLVLNGTDPVAEAAIRQLYESARQKLKSPVKKSTIIISGVTKAPLTQDEELALMAGYAAAMDASMAGACDHVTQETTSVPEACESVSQETASAEPAVAPGTLKPSGALEDAGGVGQLEDWESQTGDDLDADKTSLCMSETSSKKGRGSFLHRSAKLFFRRRAQRKEPGMSQSHNDLQYLEPPDVPIVADREKRTATFRRIINRKMLPRKKTRANGSTPESPPP
ncbi:C2 domain-containing protein 2 isoform X2 [Brachyhypopomus gauderio]|uniref:C2 domain-containing protein 2 isoform X2 n=1 Tax=Brachyhypopomus gauderio TaxID=698409 RepID=UPI0040428910